MFNFVPNTYYRWFSSPVSINAVHLVIFFNCRIIQQMKLLKNLKILFTNKKTQISNVKGTRTDVNILIDVDVNQNVNQKWMPPVVQFFDRIDGVWFEQLSLMMATMVVVIRPPVSYYIYISANMRQYTQFPCLRLNPEWIYCLCKHFALKKIILECVYVGKFMSRRV